jgi:glycosyltransferase involved in cell wall biosynthesis
MRVLHLIDPGSPGGGACTLRLLAEPLARLRSVAQDVFVVGTRAHADLARRCGVRVTGVIPAPINQPALARRALRRAVRHRERSGPYDVIHAWTLASAGLAEVAAPDRARVTTLTVGPVTGLASQVPLMMLRDPATPVLVTSTAVEREYRSIGLRTERLTVMPPGVNPEAVTPTDRAELRRRWEVDDDAFVVGLLSEPACWADARTAVNLVVRVALSGRRVRLILYPGAKRRPESERWAARLGHRDVMVMDDDVAEPWRVMNGLDAAILIGGELNSMDLTGSGSPFSVLTGGGRRLRPMPGIMPLLWVMSAGVPVIAEASDAVRDVIEDGESGLLVDQHDFNGASDRLVRLYDDRTIAGRIGMNARARVRRSFHTSAYCVRLREVYDRLTGRPVERDAVAETPPMVAEVAGG